MTLQEWAAANLEPIHYDGLYNVAWVAAGFLNDDTAYRQLWRLTDYRVTSVSGGSVWLAPVR
jgi:hypothetical protein